MDRVSSQLLLSAVTDSLISAGFDAVGTLGIDHPSFEADNDEGERDDAMALDQPQPADGKAAAAWADLCSVCPRTPPCTHPPSHASSCTARLNLHANRNRSDLHH